MFGFRDLIIVERASGQKSTNTREQVYDAPVVCSARLSRSRDVTNDPQFGLRVSERPSIEMQPGSGYLHVRTAAGGSLELTAESRITWQGKRWIVKGIRAELTASRRTKFVRASLEYRDVAPAAAVAVEEPKPNEEDQKRTGGLGPDIRPGADLRSISSHRGRR